MSWDIIYKEVLRDILQKGHPLAPRGMKTLEIFRGVFTIPDARNTLMVNHARDLNYRFMVAEWIWIARGQDDLGSLTKVNPRMKEFSDDGMTLAGAYGPRLQFQWQYIIRTLRKDPHSRQAVATIWTVIPQPSKDIPCTIAVQFLIRHNKLHSIWTMRSSDAWLGLPYDVWTFSMLQNMVAGALEVEIGSLSMQLGSLHLYERDWEAARCATSESTVAYPNQILEGFEIPDLYLLAVDQPTKAKCLEVLLASTI